MKALIVDDDRTLADLLAFTLRRAGFEPHIAFDTVSAMEIFAKEHLDIIVLDVNMPGKLGLKDGFDVCRTIRQTSDIPIILLTVRDEEDDVIRGLTIGADDYVLKPFSPGQLVARIQSVLRRSSPSQTERIEPFIFKKLIFEPNLRQVRRKGKTPISLTGLEARLLEYFMLNSGQILPVENIIQHVWGYGGGSNDMVRQLVRRLRTKIEKNPTEPELIKNLPGVGYGFAV